MRVDTLSSGMINIHGIIWETLLLQNLLQQNSQALPSFNSHYNSHCQGSTVTTTEQLGFAKFQQTL